MKYQCFYLNLAYAIAHDADAVVLFESNSMGECCSFVYNDWLKNKRDIAVYQPSYNIYRDVYRNKPRNAKGQFI